MPVAMSVKTKGFKRAEALLATMDLRGARGRTILDRSLTKAALLVQKIATTEKIVRGRGKAPPAPGFLTNRTSTLIRDIKTDFAELPQSASVGVSLIYGAVHEKGKRPFLSPALEDAEPKFAEMFIREIERELSRAAAR